MFVLEVLHDQLGYDVDKIAVVKGSKAINWMFKIGGIPLALTRIFEPYVLQVIKKEVCK